MNALTRTLEAVAAKQAARFESYAELVEQLAADNEPDAADVEETLAIAGKTTADLDRDVRLIVRRRELEAIVASAAHVNRDREKLASQRQQLADQHAAAVREHQGKLRAIQQQLDVLMDLESKARTAETELRRIAPPPEFPPDYPMNLRVAAMKGQTA